MAKTEESNSESSSESSSSESSEESENERKREREARRIKREFKSLAKKLESAALEIDKNLQKQFNLLEAKFEKKFQDKLRDFEIIKNRELDQLRRQKEKLEEELTFVAKLRQELEGQKKTEKVSLDFTQKETKSEEAKIITAEKVPLASAKIKSEALPLKKENFNSRSFEPIDYPSELKFLPPSPNDSFQTILKHETEELIRDSPSPTEDEMSYRLPIPPRFNFNDGNIFPRDRPLPSPPPPPRSVSIHEKLATFMQPSTSKQLEVQDKEMSDFRKLSRNSKEKQKSHKLEKKNVVTAHPIHNLSKEQLCSLLPTLLVLISRIISENIQEIIVKKERIRELQLAQDKVVEDVQIEMSTYCTDCGNFCSADRFTHGNCDNTQCAHPIQSHKNIPKVESLLPVSTAINQNITEIEENENEISVLDTGQLTIRTACIDFSIFAPQFYDLFIEKCGKTLLNLKMPSQSKRFSEDLKDFNTTFRAHYSKCVYLDKDYKNTLTNEKIAERVLELMNLESGGKEVKNIVERFIENRPIKPRDTIFGKRI